MDYEGRLCALIDHSLRPLTSSLETNSKHDITQKIEKHLLISLSQVLKQIQMWSTELDTNSNEHSDVVMEVKTPAFNGNCSVQSECPCGDHDCLTNISDIMVFMLSVDNRFVQHLAGNILVAITAYLVESESDWSRFVKSLCICLESTISNSLLHTVDRSQCLDHDTSHVVTTLQPKLKRVSWWSSLACVVRVLRAILKRMKQDMDNDELLIYLDIMCACLANVPWDLMEQNWNAIRLSTDSVEGKAGQLETRSVFHGALVQLCCSLVNLIDCEGADKSFNEHPVICHITNAVPTLLGWCLGPGNQNNYAHLFEYFRHKILVLMIKLSSQIVLEDSLLVFWLNLIHEYFEDLLLLPMTQTDQEDILEGSPFIPSIRDTHKREAPSRHLQRLVVLLFLRCSFSLIGLTDRKQCGNDFDLKCSCKKKGLSELRWWVQVHFPSKVFGASDCYIEKCTSFSISFLRLFIQEDDILFELLLLLFCVPLDAKQQAGQDFYALQEMNDDMLVHVSNILNPIQLFHLFLSELHYDHQVLLDYLISKDTGPSFAEYFLRSLRIICDSWTKFHEFSLQGEVTNVGQRNRPYGKKRKFCADGLDTWVRVGSSTEKGDSMPSSLRKNHQEAILHSRAYSKTHGFAFDKAKDCLLLLKKALQNLHQKELFPYDPKVLLRRLGRFQELCLQQ